MAPRRRIFIMHGERGLTPAFIARSFHGSPPSLLSVRRALKFELWMKRAIGAAGKRQRNSHVWGAKVKISAGGIYRT
jgi:hypothetical protein